MRNIRKKKMRARNRKPQKNRRSQSQTAKKQKSEEGKSARQRNPNTPIRNEFDVSPQVFWAECSDKRLSAQYLRPNIQPIYQKRVKIKVSVSFLGLHEEICSKNSILIWRFFRHFLTRFPLLSNLVVLEAKDVYQRNPRTIRREPN